MSDGNAPVAEPEIRYLGDLQRLELKPGDRLVLTSPRRLSLRDRENIITQLQAFAGGVQVLVLDDGMTLGAVGQESEARPT